MTEQLRQGPGEAARKEVAATPEGPLPSRWSLRCIRASVSWLEEYTLSGVWRLLQRYGLRLRSARVQQWSPDPEYLSKQDRLLACLQEVASQPGRVVALFLDQMGYTRWPDPARDWTPAPPVPPTKTQRSGPNNQQWRLVGSLNAVSGRVDYLDNYLVGRKQMIAHYRQLDAAYPEAERIYVIQDNWSIHTHPEVMEAVAQRERIEPVWLPTYAPWLNPIEKLWRWLRQDVLKLHRLSSSWPELRARVRAFLDQFAPGSEPLLHYVGLLGEGRLARALRCS